MQKGIIFPIKIKMTESHSSQWKQEQRVGEGSEVTTEPRLCTVYTFPRVFNRRSLNRALVAQTNCFVGKQSTSLDDLYILNIR